MVQIDGFLLQASSSRTSSLNTTWICDWAPLCLDGHTMVGRLCGFGDLWVNSGVILLLDTLSDCHQWVWETIPWMDQTGWWAKKCDPSVDRTVSWWSPSENMTFFSYLYQRHEKTYEVDWAVYPGWILLGLVGTSVCPSKREIPSWINQYDSWGQSTWQKCKLDLLEKIARITSDDMDIVFLTSGMAWKFVVRCHDDLRMFDSVKTKHDKLDDSTTVFFLYSGDIPWFNISIYCNLFPAS